MYIYELQDWPDFRWDHNFFSDLLIQTRHEQGRLIGQMESIGFQKREETVLYVLTQDVIKSSEIEGEILDADSVRSSVARHLGIDVGGLDIPNKARNLAFGPMRKLSRFDDREEGSIELIQPSSRSSNLEVLARSKNQISSFIGYSVDRRVEGVVNMMLDATQNFEAPLTQERLFGWHASLFPTGRSGLKKICIGGWRKGTVQVVSGPMDREKIHFEAPRADRVAQEMERFLDWVNNDTSIDLCLKAAIAHLWFVTIHPFDDGNGRIGRAIVDMILARSETSPYRFYSLSKQIQHEKKGYYAILEKTQKQTSLNITAWIEWFLKTLRGAIKEALLTLEKILHKSQVWETLSTISLNSRQQKIINRLLDGFEGKLTTSKWAKLAKCSQDTAYRDILDLIDKGILTKNSDGGRSTSYSLITEKF